MSVRFSESSHRCWLEFVAASQVEAREFLGKPVSRSAPKSLNWLPTAISSYRPVHLHYVDNRLNLDLSSHRTIVVQAHPKTEKEKQEEEAKGASILGTIAMAVSGFLLGKGYATYQAQSAALETSSEIVQGFKSNSLPTNLVLELRQYAENINKIDQLRFSWTQKKMLILVGAFLGGAMLAAGGFAMIPAWITAGKVALVITAVFGAVALGLHWEDNDKIKRIYEGDICRKGQLLYQRLLLNEPLTFTWSPPDDDSLSSQANHAELQSDDDASTNSTSTAPSAPTLSEGQQREINFLFEQEGARVGPPEGEL